MYATVVSRNGLSGTGDGVDANGSNSNLSVDDVLASNNGSNGIKADGSNAALYIGDSEITGNVTAMAIKNGATLLSYKNNQIDLNGSNGTPVPRLDLN